MWPDSTLFWRDKRVVVTGGAGFLGSFIVEKLQARNAAEVFVPRIKDAKDAKRERILAPLRELLDIMAPLREPPGAVALA